MGARLAAIRIHPIKALDPVGLEEARVLPSGALEGDRRWALFDEQAAFLNGKRCEAVHRLRARFDLASDEVELDGRRFSLAGPPAALEAHLGERLGRGVRIGRNDEVGFPDDLDAPGPTVVSTASLEAVCAWFPGLALEQARRRFRANLELADVPAFWEDQLFGAAGSAVPFRIGEVLLQGINPCQRCAVPSRDPDSGEALSGFQKRFSDRRRETLPAWADRSRFDHFYRLTVNTRIPASEAGKRLRVGDPVALALI